MVEAKQVLDSSQYRVVVVWSRCDRPGAYVLRQNHRADQTTSRSCDPRQRRVGARKFVAASGGVGIRPAEFRLVEHNQQQAVPFIGRGIEDLWNPLLQEGIGRHQSPWFAV